jgi:hypothetical protein
MDTAVTSHESNLAITPGAPFNWENRMADLTALSRGHRAVDIAPEMT